MRAAARIRLFRLEVAQAASLDIASIAAWSSRKFGIAAALRYQALIRQALRDIESDPIRPGVKVRSDLEHPVRTYHLAFSRDHAPLDEQVRRPRHYVVYRVKDGIVEVLRLIHDAQDLQRQLPAKDA